MAEPTILVVERCNAGRGYTRFRAVGEPSAPAWIESRRADREPWCEFTVWDGSDSLGSFGGEVWPSAWPEFFNAVPALSAQNGPVTYLTDAGKAAIARALEAAT